MDRPRRRAAHRVAHPQHRRGPHRATVEGAQLRSPPARSRGGGPANLRTQLAELVIHQQDVRRPLGIHRTVPDERLLVVLDFALTRAGGGATLASSRKRARGLRLVATDLAWSAGAGPEVRGPG